MKLSTNVMLYYGFKGEYPYRIIKHKKSIAVNQLFIYKR